jgi:O-antigen ligase
MNTGASPNTLRQVFILQLGVAILPLFHLTIKSWTNGWLVILAATSLVFLLSMKGSERPLFENWQSKAIFACLLAPSVGIFVAQLLRHHWQVKALDGPARLILAGFAFVAIRRIKSRFYDSFRWVCPMSVLICFASILLFNSGTQAWGGRFATYFVDCDTFGQHIVLLTFLTFLIAQTDENISLANKLLNYTAVVCGAYLALGSKTRGAWIALLPLFFVWGFAMRKKPARILIALAAVTLAIALVLFFRADALERVTSIYQELYLWFSGQNQETSGGVRLTMWKVSWALFKESPFFGFGEFQDYRDVLDRPVIAPLASDYVKAALANGPHNQLAAEALRSGIFGVAYTLGYFLLPGFVFLRTAQCPNPDIQRSAYLGLAVVVAFVTFSLSMEVFALKFASSFFGLLIAALSADCLPAHRIKPAETPEPTNPHSETNDGTVWRSPRLT